MVAQLRSVTHAFVTEGVGESDMADDMQRLKPAVFVTSCGDLADGDATLEAKRRMCSRCGVRFVAIPRATSNK